MTNVLKRLDTYQVFDYTLKNEEVPEVIKEDATGSRVVVEPARKRMMLSGILQRADALNQNGRIYPKNLLERELRNYQKFILENRSLGELDHPDSSVVNLKNASHIVRSAQMEGDTVYGTIEVLERTPSGAILKGLVESGVKIGISSRGVGSTKKQGEYQVVQEDYTLICFDCVAEPSTTQAFMLPEGKEISRQDLKKILNRSDRIDRILNDILEMKPR